jgi:hypothetical protein
MNDIIKADYMVKPRDHSCTLEEGHNTQAN